MALVSGIIRAASIVARVNPSRRSGGEIAARSPPLTPPRNRQRQTVATSSHALSLSLRPLSDLTATSQGPLSHDLGVKLRLYGSRPTAVGHDRGLRHIG